VADTTVAVDHCTDCGHELVHKSTWRRLTVAEREGKRERCAKGLCRPCYAKSYQGVAPSLRRSTVRVQMLRIVAEGRVHRTGGVYQWATRIAIRGDWAGTLADLTTAGLLTIGPDGVVALTEAGHEARRRWCA
jgi:hypothetical protein